MEKISKIKWLNVVLFFSLALNFFIAGYLMSDTRIFKKLHDKKIYYKRPEIRIVDYFPREEKRNFRHTMYKQHKKFMPVQKDIFENQKDIFKAIAKSKVDETELRQAFTKYQTNNDILQTAINDVVIEMVLEMDHKTRQTIIKRGERAHKKRKVKRERWLNKRMNDRGGENRPPKPRHDAEYPE
ncbi:MAG: periplasmic heavy metal sensor [Emcibacter sp.]|nr:periplasmic heavy metal sensor [Emcibacter sp.]